MNWLKRVFLGKKKVERESVRLDDVDAWLKEKAIAASEEFNARLGRIYRRIEEACKRLSDGLESLRNAALQNEKIDVRSRHAMEGNREAYCRRMGVFLANINVPAEPGINTAKDYCSSVKGAIDAINKATSKNFFVLQEFFGNETREVAKALRNIDLAVKEMERLFNESKLGLVGEAEKKADELKRAVRLRKELSERLKAEETEVDAIGASLEEELKKEEMSEKDDALIKLKGKKDAVDRSLSEKGGELGHHFAVLEAALKKYRRLSLDERLIGLYLDSPLAALYNDKELKICEVLQRLKKSVLNNEILLKDKKREKVIQVIDLLSKKFLRGFLAAYTGLKEKNEEIGRAIASSPVSIRISKLKHEIALKKEALSYAEKRLETLRRDLKKVNTDKIKEELEKKLRMAGYEIIITA